LLDAQISQTDPRITSTSAQLADMADRQYAWERSPHDVSGSAASVSRHDAQRASNHSPMPIRSTLDLQLLTGTMSQGTVERSAKP